MLLDIIYLLVLTVLSPWLVWRSIKTGRYQSGLAARLLGRVKVDNPGKKPVAWFHAVSVGEVILLGTLVPAFRKRHPDWFIVVSSTTDTGFSAARRQFAELCVLPWPFDFTWAVQAALEAVQPSLIVLTESELWPNFLHAARNRGVPVIVVNGRMSPRSFARLCRFAGLAQRMLFGKVSRFAMQDEQYAERLRQLGVPGSRVAVTGSMKFDGALVGGDSRHVEKLRRLFGLTQSVERATAPLVWVAGSTHAPEESIVLRVFIRLGGRFPQLRLILVPRHPDRFEEVARLVEQTGLPFVRRSRIVEPPAEMPAIVLLDSVGELGAAWSLADVGFTGGSLDGKRGGQSMIEPAGHGVPCLFGPHIWNFRDAARRLVESGGALMVPDEAGLEFELARLIADAGWRERMGYQARQLVLGQQGATDRTLDAIDLLLVTARGSQAA